MLVLRGEGHLGVVSQDWTSSGACLPPAAPSRLRSAEGQRPHSLRRGLAPFLPSSLYLPSSSPHQGRSGARAGWLEP